MAIDVVMPQMGESIAEGTVIRWMKKPGDAVERDEPLFEISTDKVDAEIPAPASGTLVEILVQEGQTVAVNAVVARIAAEGETAATSAPAPATKAPAPEPLPPAAAAPAPKAAPLPAPAASIAPSEAEEVDDEAVASLDERRRTKSSPLVRKIARENDVDISRIKGSGVSGRVTKNDILGFLQQPQPEPAPAPAPERESGTPKPAFPPGQTTRIEPLSVMRKKIAQHMIQSKQTSAHVTTVFEVDFTNIERLRKQSKESYAERGVNLTYLPFIVQAVVAALREFPILNSSMDENSIIYRKEMNIGIAVALDW
ncbi:MAG TPA: dihydrolipoamide acetyltransferase family protein, partial [Thermoanaerobaculia bacterium]|nr:dihydrolipoamide acetyltransferase family protein [Thermoanaerobaculia bacterium]